MQRLYSTFPGSWPGFALLMLRCVAAVALIACANADGWFSRAPAALLVDPAVLLMDGAIVVASALLIGGLWTPVAGIAQALLELYSHISGMAVELNHVLWVIVGLCVAMLGPGACSIDSHIFGRKRIDLRSSSD
jgi:hypothetical protein